MTYEIDQPVVVIPEDRRQPSYKGTISKIARTLLTITTEYGTEEQFYIETRYLKGRPGYSSHVRFWTPQQREEAEREKKAWTVLSKHGLEARIGRSLVSLPQLEAIAAILEAPAE